MDLLNQAGMSLLTKNPAVLQLRGKTKLTNENERNGKQMY